VIKVKIGSDTYRIKEDQIQNMGAYAIISTPHMSHYIFPSAEVAGEIARDSWEEMAENEPEQFCQMVGEENILLWAMGKSASPGNKCCASLDEWFEVWEDNPQEHWGSYDMTEYGIEFEPCSRLHYNPDGTIKNQTKEDVIAMIEELLGFVPKVAYRS
jgi:hypothetical protein